MKGFFRAIAFFVLACTANAQGKLNGAKSMEEYSIIIDMAGSMFEFIKLLKLGRLIKYEYVPDFQGALYVLKLLIWLK